MSTKLTRQELAQKLEKYQQAAIAGPAVFSPLCDAYTRTKVTIELPLGELMNPDIAGFVWAWKMHGLIEIAGSNNHGMAVNGLEGFFYIRTDLATAVLVRDSVHPFRINIYLR